MAQYIYHTEKQEIMYVNICDCESGECLLFGGVGGIKEWSVRRSLHAFLKAILAEASMGDEQCLEDLCFDNGISKEEMKECVDYLEQLSDW